MGGLGSGRWKKRGRRTTEAYWSLDVDRLTSMGHLRPGGLGIYRLAGGVGGPSLRLRYEAERLFLSYTLWTGGGAQEEATEILPIVRIPWRFGGRHPYFICPREFAGCGRRVSKLYLSGRYFLCRHCSKLSYASPYERQPWQLASRRANKLRQRLGITGLSVSEKPSGGRAGWNRATSSHYRRAGWNRQLRANLWAGLWRGCQHGTAVPMLCGFLHFSSTDTMIRRRYWDSPRTDVLIRSD
jgi:hypothetical protein